MLVYVHSSEIAFILLGTGPLYGHRSHINTDYWGQGGGVEGVGGEYHYQ